MESTAWKQYPPAPLYNAETTENKVSNILPLYRSLENCHLF